MISKLVATALLSLGAAAFALPAGAVAPQTQSATGQTEGLKTSAAVCHTDDGYGRSSCSAGDASYRIGPLAGGVGYKKSQKKKKKEKEG